MMQGLWRRVALFAYRRWADPQPVEPDGIPGRRSAEFPCTGYSPRKRGKRDWHGCAGDGHYLCSICCCLQPAECQHEGLLLRLGAVNGVPLRDGHNTSFMVLRCEDCGKVTGFPEDNFKLAIEEGTPATLEAMRASGWVGADV